MMCTVGSGILAAALALLLGLGCGGGGGGDDPEGIQVGGDWNGSTSVGSKITMTLVQSNVSVQGYSTYNGMYGVVAGSLNSNVFSFTTIWPGNSHSSGFLTVIDNAMAGSYEENGQVVMLILQRGG